MTGRSITTSLMAACLIAGCSGHPDEPTTAAPAADAVDTLSGAKFNDLRGDAGSGEAVFSQCRACHTIEVGVGLAGPSLHNVIGRKAGSYSGFPYSRAMSASGITWSEAKLFQYLEAPRRVVPGTAMSFPGISDPQKRADVIAYLKSRGS